MTILLTQEMYDACSVASVFSQQIYCPVCEEMTDWEVLSKKPLSSNKDSETRLLVKIRCAECQTAGLRLTNESPKEPRKPKKTSEIVPQVITDAEKLRELWKIEVGEVVEETLPIYTMNEKDIFQKGTVFRHPKFGPQRVMDLEYKKLVCHGPDGMVRKLYSSYDVAI